MVFCNYSIAFSTNTIDFVTILILIDGFLQWQGMGVKDSLWGVTILILIDGFLQCENKALFVRSLSGHNPYFNRWFSAIPDISNTRARKISHNPYFNRWFSAIGLTKAERKELNKSQSLF